MEYYKISKELMRSDMIPSHKLLLAVLTDRSQQEGYCIIEDAFLARETGMSIPNVKKIMKNLKSKGLIQIDYRCTKVLTRATQKIDE